MRATTGKRGKSAFVDTIFAAPVNNRVVNMIACCFVICNNKVNVTVSNLTKGTHSIVVVYPGDVNYKDSSKSATFEVKVRESLVNVTARNTTYGKPVVITVNVPVNQTGFVRILVDGKNYTEEINKGKAVFNVVGLKVIGYVYNELGFIIDCYIQSNYASRQVSFGNIEFG